jgi:hypothetical protein
VGANGRRVSRGRFRVVGCGAFRLDFDGGLGGEAEETALFLPVMPRDKQIGRVSALASGEGLHGRVKGIEILAEPKGMELLAVILQGLA